MIGGDNHKCSVYISKKCAALCSIGNLQLHIKYIFTPPTVQLKTGSFCLHSHWLVWSKQKSKNTKIEKANGRSRRGRVGWFCNLYQQHSRGVIISNRAIFDNSNDHLDQLYDLIRYEKISPLDTLAIPWKEGTGERMNLCVCARVHQFLKCKNRIWSSSNSLFSFQGKFHWIVWFLSNRDPKNS